MAGPSIISVVVGTAGHIDHGKSSLVKQLTGTDPDRLAEEKERGMTIDLGFARYRVAGDRTVGIIDVPGHERFIKNMVAGATSLDIVMLVVAADDGVMPQTREHLEILSLLGVRNGFVVVTKSDLVDPELLEMAVEDVHGLLQGTFLADSAVLTCSNTTGEGLDAVRAELDRQIEQARPRSDEGLFRMPIQRVFSAKGHGTVVTGVPLSGSVSVGGEVEILPLGRKGRVRAIQAYGASVDSARAGHSCALNVGDVDYREVTRGMVAGAPGYFRAATLLDARFRYLEGRTHPLQHRTAVKLHIGTAEVMGLVRILDHEVLMPGQEGLVQLELQEPVVCRPGDRFLLRQPSPTITLGGGVVLGDSRHHRRRMKDHHIDALRQRESALEDPYEATRFAAEQHRFEPFTLAELAVDVGAEIDSVTDWVATLREKGDVADIGRTHLLSGEFLERARTAVKKSLQALHKKHPLRKLVGIREVRSAADLPDPVLKAAVAKLVSQGAVVEEGSPPQLRLSSHKPALTEQDEALLTSVREALLAAELAPPTPDKLGDELEADASKVELLAGLLCDEGVLTRVGPHFFSRAAVDRARAELIKNGQENGGEIAIPALRDTLATSRKYMIPLLEFFDGTGITVRRGDKRFLRESQI